MFKLLKIFLLAGLVLLNSCRKNQTAWEILSPDGKVSFHLNLLPESGALQYQVFRITEEGSVELIEASPLGLILEDADLSADLRFVSFSTDSTGREEYEMLTGPESKVQSAWNQGTVSFQNDSGASLDLIVRLYNDGLAFRYRIHGEKGTQHSVVDEKTGFNLPDTGKAWIQPYDSLAYWAPAYEQFFMNGIDIGTTAPANKNGWCFPVLFNTLNHWIFISEAGLDTSYCGMHLNAEAPGGLYTLRFPEEGEADGVFQQKPIVTLPASLPWRFILLSPDLNDIFSSTRVNDLAAPPTGDFSWVKPGRAAWNWWSESESAGNYYDLIPFIDLAASMNWEYCLIDAGWEHMKNGDLQKLSDYANTREVGLLVWYDSGGRMSYLKNEQSHIMFRDSSREKEMKWLSEIGVKGVKIDFFHSDKQEMIKHYFDILADAAKYKLLVNFHGCTMPRGWSRTFPHLLTSEAVRGAESYRFDRSYPENAPSHNTILPFTRNVTGPMDYTPVTFSNSRYPRQTTDAHELALAVLYETGILHLADHHSVYRKLPEEIQSYLSTVPVSWDESLLIDGYPGKFTLIARRAGKNWYVSGINGTSDTLNLSIPLELPDMEESYTIHNFIDSEAGEGFITSAGSFQKGDILSILLLPKGGIVSMLIFE